MFDWKLPLFILQTLTMLITVASFIVIKFNDLAHLHEQVTEIKNKDKEDTKEHKEELHQINLSIRRLENKIVKRDAICNERHLKK